MFFPLPGAEHADIRLSLRMELHRSGCPFQPNLIGSFLLQSHASRHFPFQEMTTSKSLAESGEGGPSSELVFDMLTKTALLTQSSESQLRCLHRNLSFAGIYSFSFEFFEKPLKVPFYSKSLWDGSSAGEQSAEDR